MIKLEHIAFGGWPNCLRLSNDTVELIATTDVGPRVVYFGRLGTEQNLLWLDSESLGKTGGDEWRAYGGHRFWHAPEVKPRTYAPDNGPVQHDWDGHGLRLTQPAEELTGMQKVLGIHFHPNEPSVTIEHRLINRGQWDVRTGPWGLTMMAPGGTAIIPNEPFIPFPGRLLPARPVVLWNYTRMADSRIGWENDFVSLRQDPSAEAPAKFGARNSRNWGAYMLGNEIFMKTTTLVADAEYPDFGCNWEVFTDNSFLELETLGPLKTLGACGGEAVHVERWYLVLASEPGDLDAAFSQLQDFQAGA